jgi:hypothetical protein
MDRIVYDSDTMQNYFAQQAWQTQYDNRGDESALDPGERIDRCGPSGAGTVCPGTKLKQYDDVCIYNYIYTRVIGPAGGDGGVNFFTYRFDASNGGHVLESFPIEAVTDRAPADPNEEGDPFPLALTP